MRKFTPSPKLGRFFRIEFELLINQFKLVNVFRTLRPRERWSTNGSAGSNRRLDRFYMSRGLLARLRVFKQEDAKPRIESRRADIPSTHDTINISILDTKRPQIRAGRTRTIFTDTLYFTPRVMQLIVPSTASTVAEEIMRNVKTTMPTYRAWFASNSEGNFSTPVATEFDDLTPYCPKPSQQLNIIFKLLSDDGSRIGVTTDEILSVSTDYYESLYAKPATDLHTSGLAQYLGRLPTISAQDQTLLEGSFSLEELDSCLRTASLASSPGIDGCNARFLKGTWTTTGQILLPEANKMLQSGRLPRGFRRNLIVLIPKRSK